MTSTWNELIPLVRALYDVLPVTPVGNVDSQAAADGVDRIARVVHTATPNRGSLDNPPPHSIALSMAAALFSQPHITSTFQSNRDLVPIPITSIDALSAGLGLPVWELEDLWEEVDRRASAYMKQQRAVRWLSEYRNRSGSTAEQFFQVLFPGTPSDSYTVSFIARHARLYAVTSIPAREPMATWLGWMDSANRPPMFQSRYVDIGLRRALARAIGSDDDEIIQILDQMIMIAPREDQDEILNLDQWVSEGYAHLSGLGVPTELNNWLTARLPPEGIDHSPWLTAIGGDVGIQRIRPSFDQLAMTRVAAAVRRIYAGFLADTLAGNSAHPKNQAALFDLARTMRLVLAPVLSWVAQPETITTLARDLNADPGKMRMLLQRVREEWQLQAGHSWGGIPTNQQPHSVLSILTAHLAGTQSSLLREYNREPDPRYSHRNVLLLFAADHMANAPLARLWMPQAGKVPSPEDVIGEWFWPTWQRVLEFMAPTETSNAIS